MDKNTKTILSVAATEACCGAVGYALGVLINSGEGGIIGLIIGILVGIVFRKMVNNKEN